jgi:hypothetical protein
VAAQVRFRRVECGDRDVAWGLRFQLVDHGDSSSSSIIRWARRTTL